MKITAAVEQFLQNLKEIGRSPATITAYSKDLSQVADALSDVEIEKVTTKNLQAFIDDTLSKGFKNKTVSRKLNSIKSLFKYLHDKQVVLVDPSKPIPHPSIKPLLPNVLSETQYRGLRDATRDNVRLYTLVELMLQTGLRIGEVSRLKIEDLKLKSNPPQILITENASSPMRIVELNDRAAEIIKEFSPHRLSVEKDQGYLFNTKNGGHMIIRNIRSAVDRAFKKAGIEGLTVNDLRNTFIVKQLEAGVSLAKVAQTVGHRRFSSTEKYLPLLSRKKLGKGERIVEV